jgi:hypothetical protein
MNCYSICLDDPALQLQRIAQERNVDSSCKAALEMQDAEVTTVPISATSTVPISATSTVPISATSAFSNVPMMATSPSPQNSNLC